MDPSWSGNTVTFTVRAYNAECGGTANGSVTLSGLPSNEKPFCTNATVNGVDYGSIPVLARGDELIDLVINAGESDPYGPPSSIEICYAPAGQPASFYQTGLDAWDCRAAQNNTNTYTRSITINHDPNIDTDGLVGTYVNNPDNTAPTTPAGALNAFNKHGIVISTNISDNLSNNFCSTNVGYNGGAGVYWPSLSGCNGGTCVITIHNKQPQITAIDQAGTTYVGTAGDSDNGALCLDNNPNTYSAAYMDPDGSEDIDHIQLNLVSPANTLNPDPSYQGMRRYEFRATFVRDDYARKHASAPANGFFVRDTNTNTGDLCYRGNRSRETKGASNEYCFLVSDGHNYAASSQLLNQTLNGVNVDIYYLNSNITVYNEGHPAILRGGSYPDPETTYVAFERGGNRAWSNFVVEFIDESTDDWDGEYNQIWYVRDLQGVQSVSPGEDRTINIPGESLINVGNRNAHHMLGKTFVDFEAPQVTLSNPEAISATKLRVDWSATDAVSGISQVSGETIYAPSPASTLTPQPVKDETADSQGDSDVPPYGSDTDDWYQLVSPGGDSPLGAPYLWNLHGLSTNSISRSEVIEIGDNLDGSLTFEIYGVDQACNQSTTDWLENLYLPWMTSKGGLVYAGVDSAVPITNFDDSQSGEVVSSFLSSDPYRFTKGRVELSSEWLGLSGSLSYSQIVNSPASGIYTSESYVDANNRPWVAHLYKNVEERSRMEPKKYEFVNTSTNITGKVKDISDAGVNCNDPDKVCVVSGTNLTFSGDTVTCDRKAVFYTTGDITIDANIVVSDADTLAGCILMTPNDIYVLGGTHRSEDDYLIPPEYDTIEAFLISDNRVIFELADANETVRDGLRLLGGVLGFGSVGGSESIKLDRDMRLLNNYQYPAEAFVHDPRYILIAKEAFGGEKEAYKQEVGFKTSR